VFVVLVLLAVTGVVGWWCLRPSSPFPPIVPTDGLSAEGADALTAARKEVFADRQNPQAWGRLGLLFTAHGFDDQAAECYRTAHRLDPTDDRWPYMLALYYITDNRDSNAARQFLETAFACRHRNDQDEDAIRLRLAEAYLADRRLTDAERLFRDHLAHEPDNPRALVGLGITLLTADRPKEAIAFLQGATSSPFTRRRATTSLGAAMRLLGDHAAAERYEQQVAKLPEDIPPPDPFTAAAAALQVNARGGFDEVAALEKQGRLRDTIPILTQMAQDPANVRATVLLAQNLSLLGQPAEALPYLRSACAQDPENVQATLLLGTVLYDLAQTEPDRARKNQLLRESAEASGRAAKLNPTLATAHFSCGMAFRALGELQTALLHFRRAVECRPEVVQFQFGLLQALVDGGLMEEARARLPVADRVIPAEYPPYRELRKRIALDGSG
jgi:tetratricopeptide (TPR) repeat protein